MKLVNKVGSRAFQYRNRLEGLEVGRRDEWLAEYYRRINETVIAWV